MLSLGTRRRVVWWGEHLGRHSVPVSRPVALLSPLKGGHLTWPYGWASQGRPTVGCCPRQCHVWMCQRSSTRSGHSQVGRARTSKDQLLGAAARRLRWTNRCPPASQGSNCSLSLLRWLKGKRRSERRGLSSIGKLLEKILALHSFISFSLPP